MEHDRIVHMMIGPPGAGKSTYRTAKLAHGLLISPDEYLYEDGKYVWDPVRLSAAWKRCYREFGIALRQSKGNIVWDATFCTEISRSAIVSIAKGFGYEVEAIVLQTPKETCLARNAKRPEDRRVPEKAIEAFFTSFQAPKEDEGFDRIVLA